MDTITQAPNDDSTTGSNSAPASNNQTITVASPQSNDSNGQKSSRLTDQNPLATNFRRKNPLSVFSSYNYNLTLYMVTPECANYFAQHGILPAITDDVNGHYYIVAQSGGMNSMSDPRAITYQGELGPGKPGYDYYIDDVSMAAVMQGSDSQKTATATHNITFKVIEPIGISFLTRLGIASQQLNLNSNLARMGDQSALPNLYQQHYILGVRFYGYDAKGEIITSSGQLSDTDVAFTDTNAHFERFFNVTMGKVTFKLDGKATVYNFEAVSLNLQAAFGAKRGLVPNNMALKGDTVEEILGNKDDITSNSLIGWLNDNQKKLKTTEKIDLVQTYDIEWLPGEDGSIDSIKGSAMITDSDYSKETAPMSEASTTNESNVKTAVKSNTINTRKKVIGFSGGISIASTIDQIIVKSDYISSKLIKQNNARIETGSESEPSAGKLIWYVVNPVAKCIGRDKKTNDWAYDITFQIKPYLVPYVRSQYVNTTSKYYGPVKEYSYLFTGQNTEVISFEINYDNLFYMPLATSVNKDDSNKNLRGSAPAAATGPIDSNKTSGQINRATAVVENVRANLYSIADQALATIRVLGDPDFLMDTIGARIQSESFSQFYAKNNSVNPYGGQVFVEIIFRVAEDYKNGLLDVDPSETILFYDKKKQDLVNAKGTIYEILKVDSTFRQGKFEQVLEMKIVDPSFFLPPPIQEVSAPVNETSAESARLRRNNATILDTLPNQSDAETNRLSRQNSALLQSAITSGVRRPTSWYASGVEQTLHQYDNPSILSNAQLRGSPLYNKARIAGFSDADAIAYSRNSIDASSLDSGRPLSNQQGTDIGRQFRR
jgi:hypothetical protein